MMHQSSWSWLSDKEMKCLLQIEELTQELVIVDVNKEKSLRVSVDINPKFTIEDEKMLILVSYNDVKRVFHKIEDLKMYFTHNYYYRNTEKKEGDEVKLKKRSRFFMVPSNFSEFCMHFFDKITDPKSGIDDINKLVTELKEKRDKGDSDEVQKKIIKDIPQGVN